jgi:hypothetical protein
LWSNVCDPEVQTVHDHDAGAPWSARQRRRERG